MAEEEMSSLRYTNDVIDVYVTAGARLHLYSYLDRLQERALYCETDSFLFVSLRNELVRVEIGDNLGALPSELRP